MTQDAAPLRLSIIIPALNEEENVTATLQPLQAMLQHGHEVIVVDGGSSDTTVTRAEPWQIRSYTATEGAPGK